MAYIVNKKCVQNTCNSTFAAMTVSIDAIYILCQYIGFNWTVFSFKYWIYCSARD